MIKSQTTIANAHDFTDTFTAEYDKDHSALVLITPTTGKKIKVTGVYLSTEGASAAGKAVKVYFTGDTVVNVYVTNAVQNTVIQDIVLEGAVNETLKLTSNLGDDKNYFIAVNYREEG
jgi:hypothetical protein